MRRTTIKHEFVKLIPQELEEGTLYISIEYATAVHRCLCGCGQEVVTPISPTDWSITFDGTSISLHPSIGNWSFPCQSHYWIKRDRVLWDRRWSEEEIRRGRSQDTARKRTYYDGLTEEARAGEAIRGKDRLISRLRKWFRSQTRTR